MGSLWQRDRHRGLGGAGAGLRCRRGEMSSHLLLSRFNEISDLASLSYTTENKWFWFRYWQHSFKILLHVPSDASSFCLSAANLRAQGRRVDALRQDAGRDQREPRWSGGTGQRLIFRTPHWQPCSYTNTPKAHYTTLASSFSTHDNMNWPEETCRARRDRKDGFRRVLEVFWKVSRRVLEYICRNNERQV